MTKIARSTMAISDLETAIEELRSAQSKVRDIKYDAAMAVIENYPQQLAHLMSSQLISKVDKLVQKRGY